MINLSRFIYIYSNISMLSARHIWSIMLADTAIYGLLALEAIACLTRPTSDVVAFAVPKIALMTLVTLHNRNIMSSVYGLLDIICSLKMLQGINY